MARFERRTAEQERPYLTAESGKDRAYKAGRQKACGVGRESEGLIVCAEQRVLLGRVQVPLALL